MLKGYQNTVREFVPITTISGNNFISEYVPISQFFSYGAVNNTVDGFLYFGLMSKGGPPHNRDHYVYKYDKSTRTVVSSVEVPKSAGITSSYDVHVDPVVQFDASGRVYLIVEKAANSTGWSDGHETDVLLYRTSTPGDLSTMALWKTITGMYTYPRLWIDGANYYMMARGRRTPANFRRITMEKSTDTGGTWTEIAVHESAATHIPYSQMLASDDGLIWNVVTPRNDANGTYEKLSVIGSSDGVTWRNWQNTSSKDVVSSGSLTDAELISNYQVMTLADPALEGILFEGGYISQGTIKLLISVNDVAGSTVDGNAAIEYKELRLYTYSGGTWNYVDVSALLPAPYVFSPYMRTMNYARTLTTEHIFVIDNQFSTKTVVREYISSDGFSTWTERVLTSGTMNVGIGSHAANFKDGKFLILFDIIGNYFNYSNYSNLKVIDLN